MKATGDCYLAAGLLAIGMSRGWGSGISPVNESRIELVHANIIGQGPIEGIVHGHAWVELDRALVFDYSNGRKLVVRADRYRKIAQVQNEQRYTPEEARMLSLRTEHWGPWEEENAGSLSNSFPI